MAGSMRTFVAEKQRNRETDGGKFKGPKCWSKNIKKWHENERISPKFPPFAKVYTRES